MINLVGWPKLVKFFLYFLILPSNSNDFTIEFESHLTLMSRAYTPNRAYAPHSCKRQAIPASCWNSELCTSSINLNNRTRSDSAHKVIHVHRFLDFVALLQEPLSDATDLLSNVGTDCREAAGKYAHAHSRLCLKVKNPLGCQSHHPGQV